MNFSSFHHAGVPREWVGSGQEVMFMTPDTVQIQTVKERIVNRARTSFVGRQKELTILRTAIETAEFQYLVIFIHGVGGIGKSRLLQTALHSLGPAIRRHIIDCRNVEPTSEGFLLALGETIGNPSPTLESVVTALGAGGQRTVLALDTYETFNLLDTWLRQTFVPALPDNVLTILVGRQGPNPAWVTTPGWEDLVHDLELRDLTDYETRTLLRARGFADTHIQRLSRFARGHPLAIELGVSALRTQPDLEIDEGPPPKVLRQLTQAFLTGLSSEVMQVVEAAATVRRVTEPLLRALLDRADVRAFFAQLQDLPFIDTTNDGLLLHDVVRETVAKDLARRDHERYRTYRSQAWRFFTREAHVANARGLWQCTADMLYLIDNPAVREAFFPQGASVYHVEPASAADAEGIRQIACTAEPKEAASWIDAWWKQAAETFSVARSRDGSLEAFYILFDSFDVDRDLLRADPLTSAWHRHLSSNPVAPGERVLFLRRWLARTTGEAPSPSQAACWLDIKRTYMQLRPSLRRLYTAVTDLSTYAPIVLPLGFAPLPEANVEFGGIQYHSAILDFGPSSVDGWLARLVGAELGVDLALRDAEHGRRLLTVLFTDIVGSTEKASAVGDRHWCELLARHHDLVRQVLTRHGGFEISTTGDGFFATFNLPADAIRCACAISAAVSQLGLRIRAGLHTGECESMGDNLAGIAVHIGARVASLAEPGEVLVSTTVKDLVAGANFQFHDRGNVVLKGIPGEWKLFAVERGT
jgi:class 3 adenylate cyclase